MSVMNEQSFGGKFFLFLIILRDPRIKYLTVTQDTRFFCHQLSTMKLGFLGLSEAVKKARMVRFRRKPSVHPFLINSSIWDFVISRKIMRRVHVHGLTA